MSIWHHPAAISTKLLKRFVNRGTHYDLHALTAANSNLTIFEDDFLGDALRDEWTSVEDGSGSQALVAGAAGGIVRLTTAATNDKWQLLLLDNESFSGVNDCRISARVTLGSIADVKVEIGFADAGINGDNGAVNVLNTPSAFNGDFVCAIFDTDATEDNWQLAGAEGGTAWSDATIDVAPTATTYQEIAIEIRKPTAVAAADARMLINGVQKGSLKEVSAINQATALNPYFFLQARTAGAKTLDIDKVIISELKDTSQ